MDNIAASFSNKICVVGLGHVGLPTAALLARSGFQVVGVDTDRERLHSLGNGHIWMQEPGIETVFTAALERGHLRISTVPELADAFIIAVSTPVRHDGAPKDLAGVPKPDLSFVVSAATSIVPYLRGGNLVVLESTVPPRATVDVLVPVLRQAGLPIAGDGLPGLPEGAKPESCLFVAHCPERVLPGEALRELVDNDRVIGGLDRIASQKAREIYSAFAKGRIHLTKATTAEFVKLAENAYRDVNIALANEFALVADYLDVDIWEAIRLANCHPRVRILKPGPGVGGHCVPVDPWFLIDAVPRELTPLLQAARRVNDGTPGKVVERVKKALRTAGGHDGRATDPDVVTIGCLGLAYKADIDDIRESPAIKVVELLRAEGFHVKSYDPFVSLGTVPGQVPSMAAALDGAEMIVILVDHSEFRNRQDELRVEGSRKILIDTRRVLDGAAAGSSARRSAS